MEDIHYLHYEMCEGGTQVIVRTEAGKGAKSKFAWSPSVSLAQFQVSKLAQGQQLD